MADVKIENTSGFGLTFSLGIPDIIPGELSTEISGSFSVGFFSNSLSSIIFDDGRFGLYGTVGSSRIDGAENLPNFGAGVRAGLEFFSSAQGASDFFDGIDLSISGQGGLYGGGITIPVEPGADGIPRGGKLVIGPGFYASAEAQISGAIGVGRSGFTLFGPDGALNFPTSSDATTQRCFPAGVLITAADGSVRLIEQIRANKDCVLSFDHSFLSIKSELQSKPVVQLYENVTTEWVELSWVESDEHGQTSTKTLTTTPGHEFLTADGTFAPIGRMIEDGKGSTQIVLADGSTAYAQGTLVVYSEETADLYEQAEKVVYETMGGLALAPKTVKGWKTYNFEVADFHTYIAGGVRVHNDSGRLGEIGNHIDDVLNDFGPLGDVAGNVVGGAFHVAGLLANGDFQTLTEEGYTSSYTGPNGEFGGTVSVPVTGSSGRTPGSVQPGDFNANFSFYAGNGGGGFSFGFSFFFPVVIDLDGDGIELETLDSSSATFDFDGDGYDEVSSWVAPDDGLLVIDLAANGEAGADGTITSSREISFAEFTEADDTDFEALAAVFDTNNDMVFNALDARWSEFRIWQDANSNGTVEAGELRTLAEAGINGIDLNRTDDVIVLPDGTTIFGTASVSHTDGTETIAGDVAFSYLEGGLATSTDANGHTVYSYENGDVERINNLAGGVAAVTLLDDGSNWVGVFGNELGNIIDARALTTDLILDGGEGADIVYGGSGDDLIGGGNGTSADSDYLYGGAGNDTLSSGATQAGSVDYLFGEAGSDIYIYSRTQNVHIGGELVAETEIDSIVFRV